jgi:Secretion system C-terminal sorting domain
MKKIVFLIVLIPSGLFAQVKFKKTDFAIPLKNNVEVRNITQDFFPQLQVIEKPLPGGIEKKNQKSDQPNPHFANGETPQNNILSPAGLGLNFLGNAYDNSTPNDNDLAISNGGKIISVINTSLFFYDVPTNTALQTISYAAFMDGLDLPNDQFDPKVIYDPINDRFVTVCLNGFTDSTSSILIGFSQTNDPQGTWNLYALPGNPLNNILWTDYPIIAMTEKELFITVNLLYNDSSWQTGFNESIIWQVKKQNGYDGAELAANLTNEISFDGRPIRNLCPVKGGSTMYGSEMYFLSNRNFQEESDTIFLVNLSDTIGAENFSISIKQLNADANYYLAGEARQSGVHRFATNDSRILGAFIENEKIQFVQNCKDTTTGFTAVFHGVITNLEDETPQVHGQVVADTTLDIGYPNISYIGNGLDDDRAIISFNHSSPTVKAGCSAIKTDGLGNYSDILKIVNGASYVNVLGDEIERWGDYSGSQRKYNQPGEVWMNGYYGFSIGFNKYHRAYIGQVLLDPLPVGLLVERKQGFEATVYPNPTPEFVQVDFILVSAKYVFIELYKIDGSLVKTLMREFAKPGKNQFSFSMQDLSSGNYTLKIHDGKSNIVSKSIVKE